VLKHFLKHVTIVAGGTALSQSLLILAAPLLTRLYTPTAFGNFAVFMAILSLLLVVISLRYEMAIPLAKTTEEATHLLNLALTLVILITLLLGGIFWYINANLSHLINLKDFPNLIWLLLGLLSAGSYQALKYFGNRHQLFHLVSLTQIGQAFSQVLLQLGLGWLSLGSLGLTMGYVIAQFIGLLGWFKPVNRLLAPLHWQATWQVAKTYQHFPRYTLWASWLNVLGWQLPALLFATYFPLTVAGWYALTMRVLAMPSALVGQAVAQVFYPQAAQLESNQEAIANLLEKVATSLLLLGLPVFGLLFIQGDFLFKLFFGADWEMAGRYAEWLAPWFMTAFISSPLSSFALVKSRQRQAFWLSVYETGLRLVALSIGICWDSPPLAIQLFATAGVIISGIYLSWVFHLAHTNIWPWLARLKWVILINLTVLTSLSWLETTLTPWPYFALSVTALGISGGWFITKELKNYQPPGSKIPKPGRC